MAIRDILVCLDASEAGQHRLKLAGDLAHAHKAHLTATHLHAQDAAEPGAVYGPAALGIAIAVPLAGRVAEGSIGPAPADEPAPQVTTDEIAEQRFREVLHLNALHGEWQLLDRGETDRLIALAKAADLVVIGQRQPDLPASAEFRPEAVVVACGRPLLVVPYAGQFASVGRHALIAWDGSREAARAVHDALPLLADAAAVTVITVSHSARAIERSHASIERIVHHLARHGFSVRSEESPRGDVAVADLLLSRASDLGADLIVAGAYHHTRFREALIGGVSRDLLGHMTVPVLMSH